MGVTSIDRVAGTRPREETSDAASRPRTVGQGPGHVRGPPGEGNSKEKSARIANAAANTSRAAVGRKGGRSGDYVDWTKKHLLERARELGVPGRSSMSKAQLITALRHH